jgi:hypothetical protein
MRWKLPTRPQIVFSAGSSLRPHRRGSAWSLSGAPTRSWRKDSSLISPMRTSLVTIARWQRPGARSSDGSRERISMTSCHSTYRGRRSSSRCGRRCCGFPQVVRARMARWRKASVARRRFVPWRRRAGQIRFRLSFPATVSSRAEGSSAATLAASTGRSLCSRQKA